MTMVALGAGGKLGRLIGPRWSGPSRWLTRRDVDVTDSAALSRVLRGAQAVLCLAGVTSGQPETMRDNVSLAQSVLDAAARVQAGRVFLFSSAAVYGEPGRTHAHPLSEDGPTQPLSDYGQTKIEMEEMAAGHAHPSAVLRLGNVAGADAILGGWRPGFALDELPDGTTPRRSYIGPGTLARVLFDLTQAPDLPPILNVAAPGAIAMGDLLDAAQLVWTPRPATGKTIANVTLDTTRLSRLTRFDPMDSTAAGVVADWQQGQPA